jgi:hypothetical protein
MARTYSAIMALVGMVVVLLRGMKDGAGFDGTIAAGLCWMVLLGAIGMVVGAIAAQTVDESVRTKIEAELATMASANGTDATTTVA